MKLPLHRANGGGVLSDWITESLRESILRGHFDPGEKIDQVRTAEDFGVSLTPVREALRRLESEGFVEIGEYPESEVPLHLRQYFVYMEKKDKTTNELVFLEGT